MADVMICVQSGTVTVDGRIEQVRRDRSVAQSDHPVVIEHPELWRKIEINYPSPQPVETTPASGEPSVPEPAAKDVRAWARAQGIEVPARGPLPDDVVAAYRAAQES